MTTTVTAPNTPVSWVSGSGHVDAVDLVRVLTFACVIAVHTVATIDPPGSIPAGGALMLLHFTREAFFALTAFVLVHRHHGGGLRVAPFWRRRFLLVGVPYVLWSVIYTGLALTTAPLAPTAALAQLGHNLLTGTAWYHLYFLVVTMQFYLVFPLFLRLLRAAARWRGGHRRLLAISAVLQVGIDAGLYFGHPSGVAAELLGYAGSFVGSYVLYLVLGGVVALHAERVQSWIREHRVLVAVAFVLTGSATEAWYLRSVRGGSSPLDASAVFQPVMVPWCLAVIAALFALGVTWAARRGAGPGSRVVPLSSDRSFGVFLVHPLVLWALTLSPAAWLSTRMSALSVTIIALVTTIVVSLLVVEVLRHSPLCLALTGKLGSPRGRADRCTEVESRRFDPADQAGHGADLRRIA